MFGQSFFGIGAIIRLETKSLYKTMESSYAVANVYGERRAQYEGSFR